jgi:hypothetical protein
MPDSAFTSTGTVELAPVPGGKTEVRPLGGGAATRRDRTDPKELPLPELDDERHEGRPVAIIFAVLLLAVLGGGGWFYWNGHKTPAPLSTAATAPAAAPVAATPPAADSAPRDTTAATHDTTPAPAPAAALASDTTTKAVAEKPKPSIAPEDLDAMLAPIREDLSVGKQRMNDGEYEGALVRFGSAQDKIAPLARKYADVSEILSLRRQVSEAQRQNHAACKAERDLALEHGGTSALDCP